MSYDAFKYRCDIFFPLVEGWEHELCAQVLEQVSRESPETPVIVVSGVSLLNYAVQALKRGAWDYVTKPIHDMAVLESAVRRVIERADLLRQNREYREHLEQLNRELSLTLKQLQEVILWNTRVTPEGARALQAALPDCDVSTSMF